MIRVFVLSLFLFGCAAVPKDAPYAELQNNWAWRAAGFVDEFPWVRGMQ
jgi:hypothetical protein